MASHLCTPERLTTTPPARTRRFLARAHPADSRGALRRPLQRSRARVITQRPERLGEVVHRRQRVGVLVAEQPPHGGERLLVQLARARVITQRPSVSARLFIEPSVLGCSSPSSRRRAVTTRWSCVRASW